MYGTARGGGLAPLALGDVVNPVGGRMETPGTSEGMNIVGAARG